MVCSNVCCNNDNNMVLETKMDTLWVRVNNYFSGGENLRNHGAIAQSGEHYAGSVGVVGSSPTSSTKG